MKPIGIVSAPETEFRYKIGEEDDEEVQIWKLMEWAKDVALLDYWPPSSALSEYEDDDEEHDNTDDPPPQTSQIINYIFAIIM